MANSKTNGKPYILGLDLGVQSIGWALLDINKECRPVSIRRTGVRCFESGTSSEIEISKGKDESKNSDRRLARGQRRQHFRRAQRLRRVLRALQKAGLFVEGSLKPSVRHETLKRLDRELTTQLGLGNNHAAHQVVCHLLRAKALNERLTPEAFGRALYHLAQRRGFLSNKKARKDEKEDGVVKQGISKLRSEIDQSGARTLGEFLATLDPHEQRIRGRWTARPMFVDEFEQIWTNQSPHHPLLTADNKKAIYDAIFFQRPLKSQKSLIGRCELERHHRRAAIATLVAQRFRYLQKLNDLLITAPDGAIQPLSADERTTLAKFCEENGDLTFAKIRSLLSLKTSRKSRNVDADADEKSGYEFNLERGGEKKIPGNRTAQKFLAALGDAWRDMDDDRRHQLVLQVAQAEHEDALAVELEAAWKFSPATAAVLSAIDLEQGYSALSRRAMRKLLPGLERGLALNEVRKAVYGEQLLRGFPVCERLPPVGKAAPSLRNPVVARALSELRKVVNAIVRAYGKPETIRIELARDMKRGRKQREDIWKEARKKEGLRESARKKAETALREMGLGEPRPGDILKWLLADECNWECPYTGHTIVPRSLLGHSPQFDVEHIIPFSRSLDNSFANKTLCHHEENRSGKVNRTPFEAYGNSQRMGEILLRVGRFNGGGKASKLRKFLLEEIPDDFAQRQLSDTRYISRMAADYVALLFGGRIDAERTQRVQVSAGRMTSDLRAEWNLNSILNDGGEKERTDHRHHAVDAIVIALTGPSTVQMLAGAAEEASRVGRRRFAPIDPAWGEDGQFLAEARASIDAIHVSYRSNRRISGALHQDSNYGPPRDYVDTRGKKIAVCHIRKPLEKMSAGEIEDIVDPRVRATVQQHLAANGGDLKKAFADKKNHPYFRAADGRIIPIHKARCRKTQATIPMGSKANEKEPRHVATASNHHMEIVAVIDAQGRETKWEGHIVSLIEAVRRARVKELVVRREHGPNKRFKFSLAGNEFIEFEQNGQCGIYRIIVISGSQVEFRLHSDARPSTMVKEAGRTGLRKNADALRKAKTRKVAIDPLGSILPAND